METSPLSEYVRTGSRAALDQLIRSQIDFVYAAAVRQLRDPHLAQDVTQAVFLVLAKRAKSIHSEAALPGWLFKTTRYAAANAVRLEQRRRKHEQAAAIQRPESAMPQTQSETDELIPLLDQALARLGQSDRQIILLRYLQSREFSDVAVMLGISEIAARKRLTRAVDRLRQIFASRGQAIESTALTTTLTAAAAHAAPATVTASVLGVAASPSASAAMLAKGIQWMFVIAQAKTIAAVMVLAVIVAAVTKEVVWRIDQPVAVAAPQLLPAAAPVASPQPANTFTVTCVDPMSKPVPGAEVYLARTRVNPANQQDTANSLLGPITTDAAGIARLNTQLDLNTTAYTLYARLPGKLVGFISRYAPPDPSQPVPSSLALSMVPSYTFRGSVTMPAGFKPQSAKIVTSAIIFRTGGDVSAMLFRNAPPNDNLLPQIFDTSVNPDGSYAIADVPSNGNLYLIANAPGLAETQAFTPTPGSGPVPIIAMPREATISGIVTSPDGTPIPNITVDAVPLGAELESQHNFSATTDDHGIYIIHGLPGIYIGLYASNGSFTMPIRPVRLTTSTAIVEDLHLQTGILLTGLATDTEGKPLPNVGISATVPAGIAATLAQTTSDAAGHYTLRVPAGKAGIGVSSPPDGYDYPRNRDSQKTIAIPENATTLAGPTWRLPRAKPEHPYTTATLTGRVVDQHGNGIPNVTIQDATVEGPNDPIQVYPTIATTDSAGHYSATVTAGLPHQLSPNSDDFSSPKTRGVTPRPDESIAFPDLIVHARPVIGTISCIVTNAQGHPLDNFTFSASGAHGWLNPDNGARFTIPVRSSQTILMVSKSGYKYRNWNDLPPNAHDVQLVLYPESDTGPDYKSTTKIPSLDSLLNHPVPSLHVDWVITPPNHTPTTSLSTGRLTVLAFDWDEDKTKPQAFAADLAKICSAADAVPIIIYTPESTPSGVRAVLPDLPPNLCVGIDQFFAARFANDPSGSTRLAYGAQKMRTVYVISPDGTLIYTQQGLKGLDSHLLN